MIHPKDREISKTIKLVIDRHGLDLIDDAKRFCALMDDYLTSEEMKNEKMLLRKACVAGVFSLIAKSSPDQLDSNCRKGFYTLTYEEFIANDWATRVVNWIKSAFFGLGHNEKDSPIDIANASTIDLLINSNYQGDVILFNDNGEEVAFEKVFATEIDEKIYFILYPLESLPGVSQGESLVFVLQTNTVNDVLELVVSEDTISRVFEIYNNLLN